MASGFFDRLVARLDKLDAGSLQAQMMRLTQERGFLETIFQSLQEGVMVIDNEGLLLYANRAAEKLVGFEFARVKGRSILRFLRAWDWEHLLDAPEVADGRWSRMVTREIEVTYPEHRFISVYAVPLEESSDSKGVLVILRDVTNERQQEASALEEERSNAVKNLAASMAHEIGNPLNALNIHLQLLERELAALSDEQTRRPLQELAEVARKEVARLDTISTQFLRALRPSKPVLQPEAPAEVLEETLTLLKMEFGNRNIEVSVDIPEAVPLVKLDRQQMKQVFFNLIKNALDAMPDGSSLKIAFGVGDAFVDISFADTGCGIAMTEMGHLFDPYYTTKPEGTGLGLMIVRRIIEDHGGEIEVASKPGHGTSFKIRLPRNERRVRMLSGT